MRRQPILIVAGAFAALGIIVAGLMALGLGRPGAVPSSSSLSRAPSGGTVSVPVDPSVQQKKFEDYQQRVRDHTIRLSAMEFLPAESATAGAVEQVVQRALSQAANPKLLPRAAGEPLTGALTERLAAMLEGPDAMLRLVEEQVGSGVRSWQPPDNINWVEATDMLEYYNSGPSDPLQPLETYTRLLETMSSQSHIRIRGLASESGGSYIGFRVVRTGDLLGSTVLNSTAPMTEPAARAYWVWGRGHSIDLTVPTRGPSDVRQGASGLLVAECGFVLRTETGDPITWNSLWYWDESNRQWAMFSSAAHGGNSARILN